jgi:hypothetical protein
VPHRILRVFNTILHENEFQNPQIFQHTISLVPEQSTLATACNMLASYGRKQNRRIQQYFDFMTPQEHAPRVKHSTKIEFALFDPRRSRGHIKVIRSKWSTTLP